MAVNKARSWRSWMRLIALACAVSLLLLAVLMCAGCGEENKGAEQESEQTLETQPPGEENGGEDVEGEQAPEAEGDQAGPEGSAAADEANGEVGANGEAEPEPDGSEYLGEEGIPGGSTDFSLESHQLGDGMIRSGLEVTDISWSDEGEYFRITFQFAQSGGGDVVEVPNCFSWYRGSAGDEGLYGLFISLDDIPTGEFDYAPFAAAGTPVGLGDPLVETIERVGAEDMDPVTFLVRCAHSEAHPGTSSRPHRLMYDTGPMRVYLDIQKL